MRAIAGKLEWCEAPEMLGVSGRTMRRRRERYEVAMAGANGGRTRSWCR